MLVIASDGGLVIPALGDNWESRFTHRFAGLDADDQERTRQLLEIMRPYQDNEREASWVEAVAIADRGQVLKAWELKGSTGIIQEDVGNAPQVPSFWVFSLWYFPAFGKTYNELSPREKAAMDDHWTRLKELVQQFFMAPSWVATH
jgi:inosine/xanthosine triphosphate pyrophosphatase family protein